MWGNTERRKRGGDRRSDEFQNELVPFEKSWQDMGVKIYGLLDNVGGHVQ